MINIVVAYDNQNIDLGRYFEDCQTDVTNLLIEHHNLVKSCIKVPTSQCNIAYMELTISKLNPNPFIFIAYTHGSEDGLRCNGDSFVSINNCNQFSNSFFYSTACLTGKKLAPNLIENGCKAFIGFTEESEVYQEINRRQVFIECDNFALKMFITLNASIGYAFEAMKKHYTNKIDHLMEIGEDPLFIGSLTANREALICLGDKNLKKEDFFVH